MSSMSNQRLLNGRTVYALLYYIQIRFVLFYLFFIHALCNRYHNNIPKQAQEEGAVMTGTGLCKPWMLLKRKPTDDPRQPQHGTGTHIDVHGEG